MTLIEASEMAALRDLAESGMDTPVYIAHRTTTQTASGSSETWVEDPTPVNGWLYEFTPGGATLGIISGEMGLSETVWLRVPVGTVINSGDHARIGTTTLYIQHTNEDSTYKPWIVCAVRALAD